MQVGGFRGSGVKAADGQARQWARKWSDILTEHHVEDAERVAARSPLVVTSGSEMGGSAEGSVMESTKELAGVGFAAGQGSSSAPLMHDMLENRAGPLLQVDECSLPNELAPITAPPTGGAPKRAHSPGFVSISDLEVRETHLPRSPDGSCLVNPVSQALSETGPDDEGRRHPSRGLVTSTTIPEGPVPLSQQPKQN